MNPRGPKHVDSLKFTPSQKLNRENTIHSLKLNNTSTEIKSNLSLMNNKVVNLQIVSPLLALPLALFWNVCDAYAYR